MRRLKKAILLPVRNMAYRWNRVRIFYWVEERLGELSTVNVMPDVYYRTLYHLSMKMVDSKRLRRLADWAIHTIPYHIRFNVS